jgi:hypothetical protein
MTLRPSLLLRVVTPCEVGEFEALDGDLVEPEDRQPTPSSTYRSRPGCELEGIGPLATNMSALRGGSPLSFREPFAVISPQTFRGTVSPARPVLEFPDVFIRDRRNFSD